MLGVGWGERCVCKEGGRLRERKENWLGTSPNGMNFHFVCAKQEKVHRGCARKSGFVQMINKWLIVQGQMVPDTSHRASRSNCFVKNLHNERAGESLLARSVWNRSGVVVPVMEGVISRQPKLSFPHPRAFCRDGVGGVYI